MASPPPPPPPHGDSPKTTAGGSGLPPGKYDVFIIPEHSAGAGFLYLPSLRTNTNSFIAGFASALIVVVLAQSMAPAFQAWWANFQGMGNAGMMLLVVAVGLGAWSLGRQASDSSGRGAPEGGFYTGGGSMPGGGGFGSAGSSPHGARPGSPPNAGPPPSAHASPGGSQPSANKPNGSYQRPPPQPQAQAQAQPEQPKPQAPPPPQPSAAKPQADTPKNAWEKAREEVRRKEEERKAKEAEEKRRADAAARLKELRDREARERAQREADKARREAEAREQAEKEAKEARAKELRERLVREREERRKKLEEEKEKEKKRKEEEANQSRVSSSYAYSGVGEKTNPWPNGKPPTVSPQAGKPPTPPSPTKKPPAPTARTFLGTEEEAYSYRPYDKPKATGRRVSNSDLSESSWAPSQSTARTTPPPSVRGPYSTKDPDKIVVKAVYCFMNQFAKTPASQLISGVGSVTDGLILRITTEGLFIDDDLRGVAQREWDVKAWTLKMVEVWCPVHFLACAIAANSPPSPSGSKTKQTPALNKISTAFFAKTTGGSVRLRAAERGNPKTLIGDDADTYLTDMLASCKNSCRLGDCASKFAPSSLNDDASSVASSSARTNSTTQTGDWKAKGLHLLRATIRDQDGKRYMFVISEEEGWKVAVGLQRLRKGSQVRSLGVAGLGGLETKNTLEMLGWG